MKPSKYKTIVFRSITVLIGVVLTLIAGEILVRVASPQPYMYPRFKFSEKYGILHYENEQMVDGFPGHYEFYYTTNEFGFRGKLNRPADIANKFNIVVIGDSYSFGKGVNDGEEYPSVMQRIFGRDTVISNISMMGWGLTQEIRAYNEYGLAYKPKIVLLQFCQNDPYDNLSSPVTEYANGGFIFKNTGDISSPKIQAVISRSLIQKSQLFNFIRLNVIIPIFGAINKESAPHDSGLKAGTDNGMKSNLTKGLQDTLPSLAEKRYAELIIPFAKQLSKQGIHLVMISVNGELAKYPFIERTVQDLNMKHYLHYVEVRPWFMGVADYSSPEGHVWGKKGHTIIAENLVGVLRENH